MKNHIQIKAALKAKYSPLNLGGYRLGIRCYHQWKEIKFIPFPSREPADIIWYLLN